jgi:hypothetical protein
MSNLSYMTNLDWARRNPDVAGRLFLALARAGRDYCQAYHHGPNRGEVLDILLRNKVATDRTLLDKMDWQARDPNGRFNLASIASIQSFFRQEGMVEHDAPLERLATNDYADRAATALGPFAVINHDSKLEGCR